ncbi:helix-turn-helix transcriptional regulator [Hassallia byssoidea VB512170]|uniref:Helix-turn-helix transcriptional regulator n=1 Tax=Hassallia byssoidea VB512170 TaxID=1304833 RepID=A0A846HB19_9CYAN|nr:helix-turn-helix transcriptional regulator [Hassalia byssoidea VB512170]
MSNNEPPEHLHLLSSFEAGWEGLNLLYEIEPADEMPEIYMGQHFIVIALDNFRASYMLNESWQQVDYAKGDIAIIPASQPFPRTQIDREVPLVELFLEPAIFNRVACESVDADNIEIVPQWHIRDPLIQHMGLALKAELEASGADSRLYVESMATALSVHLLRRYSARQQQIKNYTGGLPKYRLREAVNYINEHLDHNLTLAEVAASVQMSPHYFASLFKQSTGLTPHQYVMKCRIDKAKQLLHIRELTLVEICHQVGFQSQSHFTRVFREHTKTTPKVYRDAL